MNFDNNVFNKTNAKINVTCGSSGREDYYNGYDSDELKANSKFSYYNVPEGATITITADKKFQINQSTYAKNYNYTTYMHSSNSNMEIYVYKG